MYSSSMRSWVRQNYQRYNNDREKLIGDCMVRFNHTHTCVKDLICKMRRMRELPVESFPGIRGKKTGGLSKDTRLIPFRESVDASEVVKDFDDEGKIIEGIKTLGSRLIRDNDFRMELGIPVLQWKQVSCQSKFSNNKQELKGRRFRGLYWGDERTIKDLRKKLEL